MASYACCLVFFIVLLSISLQTHARESKFFSKVTKTSKENHESISVSPTSSPSLAPAPEPVPEVVEHGYGLYGREPYDQYAPTTENPVKTAVVGEEKYVDVEDLGKNDLDKKFEKGDSYNFNGKEKWNGNEKQGMSDTRFLENGKYYYDVSNDGKDVRKYVENEGNEYRNGNEKYSYDVNNDGEDLGKFVENEGYYGNEKHGMSDTRFLENGKYYYDVNNEGKDVHKYVENEGNEYGNGNENEYVNEKQGVSDNRLQEKEFVHLDDIRKENENGKKQGMSDTRFLENGKYYFDANHQDDKFSENEGNVNENENVKNFYDLANEEGVQNREFVHLDDIRKENEYRNKPNNMYYNTHNQDNEEYLYNNNGYGYGYSNVNRNGNEEKHEDKPNNMYYNTHNQDNEEYLNNNNGYGYGYSNVNRNGNEEKHEGKNGYVSQESGGYNHFNGNTKKFPNEYDTMEEYDREQGIVDPQDAYVP